MSQSYDLDELEAWVTIEHVDELTELDPYKAESIADNPDATREILEFSAEGRANSWSRGDAIPKGMLPDRFSIAPDITVTVYERRYPQGEGKYKYLMNFAVGNEVYTAITFTGSLLEILEHTLFEIEDSIDGVRDIYNVSSSDPDYNYARDFVNRVDEELRGNDLKGALYEVIEAINEGEMEVPEPEAEAA